MKTKTFISVILLFACCLLYGQNYKPERVKGSWIGNIILPNNSSIQIIMNFSVKDNLIEGEFDIPVQSFKDVYMDSVRVFQDSVVTDLSSTGGPGTFFKG
jgi:hypothetical protein